jgi:putative DNA primase/helicase
MKVAGHLIQLKGSSSQIVAVRRAILANDRIQVEKLGCENMVCLNNGVLDLDSMTFMPHDPKYLFDYKLNVTWKASYTNSPPPTPAFDTFLQMASGGDQDWMMRALEIIGCILVNDCKTKSFYLLQGEGDSGKSVFGNMLKEFFDAKQVSALSLYDFDGRFSMAAIAESKLNLSMDLTNGTLTEKAAAQLKMLTGGDMISVEQKNKPIFSTYVRCSLLFGTNHRLKAASMNDPAFVHRICYLPFRRSVPRELQDRNLNAKLRHEMFGIFCKAVVAYKNLVARGYEFSGSQKFAPINAMAYGDVVNDQEDILSAFVSQCLVLNPMAFTPTDILFSAYNAFCNGQGIQDYNTFSKNLSNMLAGNAAVKATRKRLGKDNKRGYEGVALR